MYSFDIDIIKNLYLQEEKTCNEIGKIFSCSDETVRRYLKCNNIIRRKNIISVNNRFKKYTVDSEYFSIPNIENSYWAGFIAADGCISKQQRHNRLKIGIIKTDVKHLELFKEHIHFTGPIRVYKNLVIISIESKNICDDLEKNFRIVPRKSLILKPPNINDFYCKMSFIAGVIDGDGSINIYKNRNSDLLNISILGTFDLLNWIKIITNELGIKSSISKKENIYRISYCSHGSKDLSNLLFEMDIPRLYRKWNNTLLYNKKYRKVYKWILEKQF